MNGSNILQYRYMTAYLIKLIVDFASINTLRKQSFNGIPWNFFWRKIGSSLKIIANTCTISMFDDKTKIKYNMS